MSYVQKELQSQIDTLYDNNGKVTDDDIYEMLEYYIDDIPADIDVIELNNPRVKGRFIIEFTQSFFEYKQASNSSGSSGNGNYDEEEDFDEEEDYRYDADEFYIIHRVYDSTDDEDNDEYE